MSYDKTQSMLGDVHVDELLAVSMAWQRPLCQEVIRASEACY